MAQTPTSTPALEESKSAQSAFEELDTARTELEAARKAGEQLSKQTKALREYLAAINRAMVTVADRSFRLEQDVTQAEERLTVLQSDRSELSASLKRKRAALTQVIGALQRIGRNPPPALLIHPENALRSVRSSILLSSVIPHMRDESKTLLAELRTLTETTREIENTSTALAAQLDALAEDENRLTLLIEEKRRVSKQSQVALADEQQKITTLADRASALEGLIKRLEREAKASAETAQIARARDEARRSAELARLQQARERLAKGGATPEDTNLIALSDGKASTSNTLRSGGISTGSIVRARLPVNGKRVAATSAFPSLEQAIAFTTKPRARVRAPNAGTVLFAGPFRTFGTLLILDAGSNYTWVIAGLRDITVAPGQRVVAGEPVGKMGAARVAAAVVGALGSDAPLLYVELRKDGKAIDPAPLWAAGAQEGPKNDS
ncbi:MAG: peptidoglycan DD-metalloendopeptidase family protein [Pseudomonadota bacterium]